MRKWSVNVVHLACVWVACACRPEKPDVLQEFPPPRLANLAPNNVAHPHDLNARCSGELVLKTRGETTSLPIAEAHGTIELGGGASRVVNATLSVPLPEQLGHTSSSAPTLEWRVLEVRSEEGFESAVPTAASRSRSRGNSVTTSLSVVASVELNRVRTQAVHRLEFEYADLGLAPNRVHLSRLVLDVNAHRLKFPGDAQAFTGHGRGNGTTHKRAELSLHCGLAATDRSEK